MSKGYIARGKNTQFVMACFYETHLKEAFHREDCAVKGQTIALDDEQRFSGVILKDQR